MGWQRRRMSREKEKRRDEVLRTPLIFLRKGAAGGVEEAPRMVHRGEGVS